MMNKEKTSVGMTLFGGITIAAAALGNLLHGLFTLWASLEQMETGWGGGTGMEMAVLVPWFLEWLCVPVFVAGIVLFLLSIKRKVPKGILIANGALYGLLVLQFIVFNLFTFY